MTLIPPATRRVASRQATMVLLYVKHACADHESYAVPSGLGAQARARVVARLASQRCWRCVIRAAWEDLAPWASGVADPEEIR